MMGMRGQKWVSEFLVMRGSRGEFTASDGFVFGKGSTVEGAVKMAKLAQVEFDSPVPGILAEERRAG